MGRTRKVLMAVFAAAAVIAASAGLSSCEKYILPTLTLSQDTLLVNKNAQELSLVVNTGVYWSFDLNSANADWLTVTPDVGLGTATVKIQIEENSGANDRSATVPVKTATLERNLYIVQSADDVLPEP